MALQPSKPSLPSTSCNPNEPNAALTGHGGNGSDGADQLFELADSAGAACLMLNGRLPRHEAIRLVEAQGRRLGWPENWRRRVPQSTLDGLVVRAGGCSRVEVAGRGVPREMPGLAVAVNGKDLAGALPFPPPIESRRKVSAGRIEALAWLSSLAQLLHKRGLSNPVLAIF